MSSDFKQQLKDKPVAARFPQNPEANWGPKRRAGKEGDGGVMVPLEDIGKAKKPQKNKDRTPKQVEAKSHEGIDVPRVNSVLDSCSAGPSSKKLKP